MQSKFPELWIRYQLLVQVPVAVYYTSKVQYAAPLLQDILLFAHSGTSTTDRAKATPRRVAISVASVSVTGGGIHALQQRLHRV